jgi:hypothetical protein
MNPKYGMLDVRYNNKRLWFEDHTAYESRNKSMVSLIKDAWELLIRSDEEEDRERFFTLYTDDIFNPYCHYSFSSRCPETARRSMPNFIFESWPECGMAGYEQVFGEMARLGSFPYEDERAFWIGNVAMEVVTYAPRRMGAAVARKDPGLIDFKSVDWKNKGLDQFKHTPGYTTLPDHCRYRVLIDFGGAGFSARIPLLLASGRPVILVGHPEEAWFYWDGTLVPWVHYVPCGAKDGRDVSEELIRDSLRWTFDNASQADDIGVRGREYAEKHLTRRAALERIGEMMSKHGAEY